MSESILEKAPMLKRAALIFVCALAYSWMYVAAMGVFAAMMIPAEFIHSAPTLWLYGLPLAQTLLCGAIALVPVAVALRMLADRPFVPASGLLLAVPLLALALARPPLLGTAPPLTIAVLTAQLALVAALPVAYLRWASHQARA